MHNIHDNYIRNILNNIQNSVDTSQFVDVENTQIELKAISHSGEWNSLYETVCAFLNTDGGIIIGGIKEKDKQYIITGFDRRNEANVIDLHNTNKQKLLFQDDKDQYIDLSDKIYFEYYTIKGLDIIVIIIIALAEDEKYLHFKGKYYERKLTQDREIPVNKLLRHKEYKADLEYAKEIANIKNTGVQNFSLNKINDYIFRAINRYKQTETLKSDLAQTESFLGKQHFLRENATTLGLLVCGDDPFQFLEYRAEVDCYYEIKTQQQNIQDKKIFKDDVIHLMEESFSFVWKHISVGVSVANGGKESPEYSEELLREMINNALAHRDYTINHFTLIVIEPRKHLMIENPGTFKEKMKLVDLSSDIPLRRLIPGMPESKNPKLANVLKMYEKIENRGRGMAALVHAALNNEIDLPYYKLIDNKVQLFIPSGKLLDESIEIWLKGFENYLTTQLNAVLSIEHKQVLAYFRKSELENRKGNFTILLSEGNNHFSIIDQLQKANLIHKHPASTTEATIFLLSGELMQTDFSKELLDLIGNDFCKYHKTSQHILHLLYQYTVYNKTGLRAVDLTPEVYRRLAYSREENPKKYELIASDVRRFCKKLLENNILIKDIHANNKFTYLLNLDYQKK